MRPLASLPTPFRALALAVGISAVVAAPAMAGGYDGPPRRAPTGWSARDGTCFGLRPTITIARRDVVTNGTDGDDVIVGTSGRDVIFGKKGDDRICGLGGPDRLVGNLGDDMLDGDGGADIVAGWWGDDTIVGGGADDILRGNRGDDIVYADGGGDVDINLGPGNDWGFGGNGDDFMSGFGDGALEVDNCYGGNGFDTARNCDQPVNPLTSLFDAWSGNQFERIGPSTAH